MAETYTYELPPVPTEGPHSHAPHCNASRNYPRGTPGSGCSCPPLEPVWRYCRTCKTRYRPDTSVIFVLQCCCPQCHGHQTEQCPGLSEDPPHQPTLFTLPPAPKATAWIVEWRWRKATQEVLANVIDPKVLPSNDWLRHSIRNIATERRALSDAARLRRTFPAKSFRVVAVSWEPAAEPRRPLLKLKMVPVPQTNSPMTLWSGPIGMAPMAGVSHPYDNAYTPADVPTYTVAYNAPGDIVNEFVNESGPEPPKNYQNYKGYQSYPAEDFMPVLPGIPDSGMWNGYPSCP